MQLLCTWCSSLKPEKEFVKRIAKEPYSQKNVRCCRDCNRAKNKDRYHGSPEIHRKQAEATRRWSIRNKDKVRASHKRYEARNDVKRKAKQQVRTAVKNGRLERLPCAICGTKQEIHGHHDSYEPENWLDVRWLCRDHHKAWHRILNPLKIDGEGKKVVETAFNNYKIQATFPASE